MRLYSEEWQALDIVGFRSRRGASCVERSCGQDGRYGAAGAGQWGAERERVRGRIHGRFALRGRSSTCVAVGNWHLARTRVHGLKVVGVRSNAGRRGRRQRRANGNRPL